MGIVVKTNKASNDEELNLLINLYGWRMLKHDENTVKLLENRSPYTFILGLSDHPYEDILLFFIDSSRMLRTKPIHIIQKSPEIKLMNGTNRIYSNIKELIAEMMECRLDQLKPILEKE